MKFRYIPFIPQGHKFRLNRQAVQRSFILFTVTCCVLLSLGLVSAQEKFKLKEGATGKVCLDCHDTFEDKMKKAFVHSPLADGECTGCHNPHASSHSMLMAVQASDMCYVCHDSVVEGDAKSVHKVVAEGQCISCHDPHASDNKANLLKKGSDLCAECHQTLVTKINESKYGHPPVRENCMGCHSPHASSKNIRLLNDSVTTICIKCHSADKPTFKKLHREYPVEKADCTSCHDPHGSNTAAMLYDNVHDPVAKRNCNRCHVEPTFSEPFQLKAQGYETCQACHYEMITDALNHNQVHWPLVDKKGCMNCHAPHATPEKKLMRKPMLGLCADCHGDTVARQARATTKHPPIAEGDCGACHSLHSSSNRFMLKEESIIDVCAQCHEWQKHSTHPIGEKYVDPRNKNVTLDCASCHRTHGSEHKMFLYFSTTNELCVQCHTSYRR